MAAPQIPIPTRTVPQAGTCVHALGGIEGARQAISRFNEALMSRFGERIHYFTRTNWEPNVEFYASNEFDWFRAPHKFEKADVVIGFGTNSVWDIAYRRKARRVIIADWNPQVIVTQEMLIRPLILEAKTPAEFFSFISMLPLKPAELGLSTAQAFNLLRSKRSYTLPEERLQLIESILARLKRRSDLTQEHLAYIETYFIETLRLQSLGLPLGSIGISNAGPILFAAPRSGIFSDFFQFYIMRYDPANLVRMGAPAELVLRPDFSVFSSQESFMWLQEMFRNGVQYAVADVNDMGLYRSVAQKMLSEDLKGIAVSTSNIFSCNYNCGEGMGPVYLNRFKSQLTSTIGAGRGAIDLHHVEGAEETHQYHVERLSAVQ